MHNALWGYLNTVGWIVSDSKWRRCKGSDDSEVDRGVVYVLDFVSVESIATTSSIVKVVFKY